MRPQLDAHVRDVAVGAGGQHPCGRGVLTGRVDVVAQLRPLLLESAQSNV